MLIEKIGCAFVCPCEDNNPLLLHSIYPATNSTNMKIQKTLFLLPRAMQVSSRRLGIRPLRNSELLILYAVDHLTIPPGKTAIHRFLSSMDHPMNYFTVHSGVDSLLELSLLELNGTKVSISYLGRDYLSSLRRFLINKRLN